MENYVSIIIPVYNAEKYLLRTVESILASSYENFELILINDASQDNSEQICRDFAESDTRVKYISNKTQLGASGTRNIGLETACGEFIMFVDSDDTIDSHLLEYLMKSIGNADLAIADLRYVRTDGVIIKHSRNPQFKEKRLADFVNQDLVYMCRNCSIYGPYNKLYRKSILRDFKICFDEKMTILEDTKFVFDYLSNSKKISSTPKVYYNYYQNPCSLVSRFAPTANYSVIKYWETIKKMLNRVSTTSDEVQDFFRNQVSQYSLLYTEHIYSRSGYTPVEKFRTMSAYTSDNRLIQIAKLGNISKCSIFRKLTRYLFLRSNSYFYRFILHLLFILRYRKIK